MFKRKVFSVLLVVAIFFMPFAGLMGMSFLTPTVYHNSFLAELPDKYERLNSVEGEKIIVIGGSSVAFGLDSQLLEQAVGMPVVNFGLYASLGSKVMLDLSRNAIGPGDIVVLAFEMDNQTLSMYFNADSMWQAVDCDYRLLLGLRPQDYGKMAGGFYRYAVDKLGFLHNGVPDPEGVYNKDSFNAYGDIAYVRDSNIMAAGFDANQMIRFEDLIIEEAFAAYVNEFIAYATAKGAQVCVSFCPMNRMAVTDMESGSREVFISEMKKAFRAPFISRIDDYIMDAEYFYDTNFHLNDRGTVLRTIQLAYDLSHYYGLNYQELQLPQEHVEETTTEPTAQGTVPVDVNGAAFEDCFLYTDFYGAGWAICGVTEEGKNRIELEIPQYHDGQTVLAIMADAFCDCTALETITVYRGEGDSLTLYDGAFSNVQTLRSVNLHAKPDSIKIGTEGLLINAAEGLRFFVEKQNYGSYVTDYYWSIYADKIKVISG